MHSKCLSIHQLFYLKFVKCFIASFIFKKFFVKEVESSPLQQPFTMHTTTQLQHYNLNTKQMMLTAASIFIYKQVFIYLMVFISIQQQVFTLSIYIKNLFQNIAIWKFILSTQNIDIQLRYILHRKSDT